MKIKDGFIIRTVLGQSVVMADGAHHLDFNKIITLNSSALLLWNAVAGREFTNDDLARILVDNYGIDYDRALADASDVSAKWIENGLVDD